jgi:hypothetical protein
MRSFAVLGFAAANDWSYFCIGASHGCILAQHDVSQAGGFYETLAECEQKCPRVGKEISYRCEDTGNCVLDMSPPNPSNGTFASFQDCTNAPSGKCFAPGSVDLAYECHGNHFGCVLKQAKPDDSKGLFKSFDDCEEKCHSVPQGLSFGCAGSRPNSCVLVEHAPDEPDHYFTGINECEEWCKGDQAAQVVV